ncbi:MAG: hypothetical protein HDT33_01615 [Clostridiales bacterium]|nr:hypothetical protein [Clostridiales bacterium]
MDELKLYFPQAVLSNLFLVLQETGMGKLPLERAAIKGEKIFQGVKPGMHL